MGDREKGRERKGAEKDLSSSCKAEACFINQLREVAGGIGYGGMGVSCT